MYKKLMVCLLFTLAYNNHIQASEIDDVPCSSIIAVGCGALLGSCLTYYSIGQNEKAYEKDKANTLNIHREAIQNMRRENINLRKETQDAWNKLQTLENQLLTKKNENAVRFAHDITDKKDN